MDEIDKKHSEDIYETDEDMLFMGEVIQGEHTLLYLDSYLRDIMTSER